MDREEPSTFRAAAKPIWIWFLVPVLGSILAVSAAVAIMFSSMLAGLDGALERAWVAHGVEIGLVTESPEEILVLPEGQERENARRLSERWQAVFGIRFSADDPAVAGIFIEWLRAAKAETPAPEELGALLGRLPAEPWMLDGGDLPYRSRLLAVQRCYESRLEALIPAEVDRWERLFILPDDLDALPDAARMWWLRPYQEARREATAPFASYTRFLFEWK